ncbi:twin-arginine translocase TatA/TatE family subunit [Zavarzinella formosa]|uniref:twin-arginine translocase TatA/TatE family subunit n=1 Tax=Zavarzinella formosa TaxID=360055 RepID=UPI0002DBA8DB|nr:twin-arginine translocase TatA/TatE family subunit [Zavarzinella formosa]
MSTLAFQPLFAFFGLGTQEIMLLLVLGVLLFGRNLPSLGRSLGKTVTEFKKGVKGLEDDMEPTTSRTIEPEPVRPPQRVTSTAPKFEDSPPPKV